MTNDKPTDYAALLRASAQAVPEPPEWLTPGKHIYSPDHGIGEVMALLGKRLIVRFVEEVNPTQFADWEDAIANNVIQASKTTLASSTALNEEAQESDAAVISEQIQQIPHLGFRAIAQELALSLVAADITEGSSGLLHPIPKDLPLSLRQALHKNSIAHLYSHQLEALVKLRSGFDLSLVTPTASGKTLCYNLAILESCLKQPRTTALYIFPLKALALDQMRKLHQLVKAMPPNHHVRIGLMTGDTPKEERQRLFIPNPPNILAVSPDLLHHYLYNTRRRDEGEPWRQFLRQLRWVVVDESHTYIGAFGAHFANLMRRLRLAVDAVGGNSEKVQFICSSATIGNPTEMALRFSGRTHQPQKLHLIERSGAFFAGRTLLCLAPSSAANADACKIIISWLQHDLSGIVFCNSRTAVKSLLGLIQRETQRQGFSYLSKVAVFHSSLTGDRRRDIIHKLQRGHIKVIISTSALEAGIDLPELDCCLIRGFPGSLMSFWQRVGRAGRKQHGLVIFLPLAQNPIDVFYAKHSEQLRSQSVENAAFNPDYPTILGKHLECGCIESSIAIEELTNRFSTAAGSIADSLMQQNKLFLSSNGRLWGKGYPHKDINLRSSPQTSLSLIDSYTGEILETMSLSLAYQEVFPEAIYALQDETGELIAYRSKSLDEERGEAILERVGKDNDLFTEAETDFDIQPLSNLADPKIIHTSIPEGRLRLTLVWGEITTLVTGYRMLKRTYGMTCVVPQCANYRKPLEGKTCSCCKRPLRSSEITKLTAEVAFKQPYKTQYQAPCLLVEVNQSLQEALASQITKIKKNITAIHGNSIPEQFQDLWSSAAEFTALHSMQHQIVKAVPLVVLSSSLDVDGVVTSQATGTVAYYFDTCDGGNGATEAIFHQLPAFAAKAYALAVECGCESGCPRCLHASSCPQHNAGLHKDIGLFLLNAISG